MIVSINKEAFEAITKICQEKDARGLTWSEVSDLISETTGVQKSREFWRVHTANDDLDDIFAIDDSVYDSIPEVAETVPAYHINTELLEIKKEKIRMRDERNQVNEIIRNLAREENLAELAREACKELKDKLHVPKFNDIVKNEEKEGILQICDWHYGESNNSAFNVYNPEVFVDRINNLYNQTLENAKLNGISRIHIANLGDMISGFIHDTIRINNRCDVVTQTLSVSAYLIDFIEKLSEDFYVDYYDCLDNHARCSADKTKSMKLESFTRFIHAFLIQHFALKPNERVTIHENDYGYDTLTFEVLGHSVVGVHGDLPKDTPGQLIDRISSQHHKYYDLYLSAHLHTAGTKDENNCNHIMAGCLGGTSMYAEDLRYSTKPSQNFIVVTKDNPTKALYKMLLA